MRTEKPGEEGLRCLEEGGGAWRRRTEKPGGGGLRSLEEED